MSRTTRPIILNAFGMNCVTHIVSPTVRHPQSQAVRYTDLRCRTELAQLLERGLFDGLFIADVLGIYDVCRPAGSGGPSRRADAGKRSAACDAGDGGGDGARRVRGNGRTSFEQPYPFAWRMSTLDQRTNAPFGWNVVAGVPGERGGQPRADAITLHGQRSDIADEFPAVTASSRSVRGRTTRSAPTLAVPTTPSRGHPIGHDGRYFRVPRIRRSEPSPQRTPVLHQANASNRGRRFGATHGEVVFLNEPTLEGLRDAVADIRGRAATAGRDPYDVKIVNGLSIVAAASDREAQTRLAEYRSYLDPEATLMLWSGWVGSNLSRFALDDRSS